MYNQYAISSVELANQQRSQNLRTVTNPITLMMGGTIVVGLTTSFSGYTMSCLTDSRRDFLTFGTLYICTSMDFHVLIYTNTEIYYQGQ